MKRRTLAALVAAALVVPPALTAAAVALSGQPTTAEAPFVTRVSADLGRRFPTPAQAEKAGYLRYTDEDETGAISYAGRVWTSADPAHPSQLWYDVKGRLLGADYSVLQADSPDAPHRFGIEPARWFKLGRHIHYGLAGANGTTIYGAVRPRRLVADGADPDHPTPDALVAAGVAKRASDVRFVFVFPAIWDVTVWLIPNPDGAFAEANPNVKPVHPPKPMNS